MSTQEGLHKIKCICNAITYVLEVPDVFVCEHFNALAHPDMKWFVCPNDFAGSWIPKLTHIAVCKSCEEKKSVIDLGYSVSHSLSSFGVSMQSKSPGDYLDYKTEGQRQTELLESILALLQKREEKT
ncbi:MAG: hypothetical protein ACREBJ_07910 [Nitrosotalea sp.]